jgi:hypothetical protein
MVQNIADRQANTVLLAGQAVDRATLQGLKTASAKSGVSFHYLVAKAAQESSLNPDARAETSSATGLFQFTRGTWLDMVKRYGSQYGFADLSRQILETPSGRLTVTDAAAEKRILALRQDPEASALMAAEFARDNAASLEGSLGHMPDASELYLAHFLGANGAATLLNTATHSPSRDAEDVLPAAAKANPSIFTTTDGAPRSAAQVVQLIRDRFTGQMNRYAAADTVVSDASPVSTPQEQTLPSSAATQATGKLDLRQALAGGEPGRSPVSAMIMDQLMRLISSNPMVPAEDEEENDDPLSRPLNAGGLRSTDWAEAMAKRMAPETAPQALQQPQARPAARAYDEADGTGPSTTGQSRAVDDVI